MQIRGDKCRLAVLSLFTAEISGIFGCYFVLMKAPDSATKPVSSCFFSVITGYQRRVRLADQVEVP
jgi:hypothetical protein